MTGSEVQSRAAMGVGLPLSAMPEGDSFHVNAHVGVIERGLSAMMS